MNPGLHCTTIPAELPFLNTLAGWILDTYGQDRLSLPKTLVLLPNRRACRSLQEAFLKLGGGKPVLLPRIQPIGDTDSGDFSLYHHIGAKIPGAISPLRRQLLLTRLVMDFERARAGRIYNVAQAAELARQLAQLLDDMAREGLSFSNLEKIVPQEPNLQKHWQQTLEFLQIISRYWPGILETENALDPVDHRNRVLAVTALALKTNPPDTPVIAAGSTGSQPATAALLAVIARLPKGMLVLPGLDTIMPDKEWDMVAETHPQFAMKSLLKRLACKRNEVKELIPAGGIQERAALLRAVLQPPQMTAHWGQSNIPLAEGCKNIRLLEADTPLDEARMIAVALREALETREKTAALVTPDRTLARMVAAQMQRFGIGVDDSAGHKLADTPGGCFLRLVVEMAVGGAAPSSLLALLRHPLAAVGMETATCRRLSRLLEKECLRGIRRAPGFAGLHCGDAEAKKLIDALAKRTKPLMDVFTRNSLPLVELLGAHIELAEWLASTPDVKGADRLWAGEAGNHLASFLSNLIEHADVLADIDPASYPGLFESLLAEQSFWPRYGQHPRLHILSPIEARLQQFDMVILAGLNEGTWPALPATDPWMSRPMRAAFGLPLPERSIGQGAHDFTLLASQKEVLLSRSRKADGVPTIPSRWLVRLNTLVGGLEAATLSQMQDKRYEQARIALDTPIPLPGIGRPEPKPPLVARPRKMKVTDVDNWFRDPYMIYARYVLNLRKLDPLDKEPDQANFGTLVHKALEKFVRAWPSKLPDDPRKELLAYGEEVFAKYKDFPMVQSLWLPRFEAMAEWLLDQEIARRPHIGKVYGELEGKWTPSIAGKLFELTTRIDRLEVSRDGNTTAIDYKTGSLPEDKHIREGLSNQLLLEAIIAMQGTLTPSPDETLHVTALEYWKLKDKIKLLKHEGNLADWLRETEVRFFDIVQKFDDTSTPYAAQTNAALLPRYNDYEHLTRREEWEAV